MFNSSSGNSVVHGLAALDAGLSQELLSIRDSLVTCNRDLVTNDLDLVVSNGYPFHIKKTHKYWNSIYRVPWCQHTCIRHQLVVGMGMG